MIQAMSSKVCLFLDSSLVAMCSLPNIPHSVFYHRKTGLTYLNVTQASGNDGVSGASLEPNPPPLPRGDPFWGIGEPLRSVRPWPCLGQNNSKIHTLFTATSSIVLPCLRQRTERTKCTTSCLKPFIGNCYRANSLYMKSLLLNTWSTNNSTCSKSNQSCRQDHIDDSNKITYPV